MAQITEFWGAYDASPALGMLASHAHLKDSVTQGKKAVTQDKTTKLRRITLDQAEALATQWKAQYREHLRSSAITSRFADATPSQVVHMWKTGRKERGEKLTQGEFAGLVERWLELFGAYPPDDNGNEPGDTATQAEEPAPQDDAMLSHRDVVRMTGLSLSTIKRMVNDGRLPKPMRLSPRRNGWPAREVKAWINGADEQRRATRH